MLLRAITFAVALSLAAGSALAITETVSTVHRKKKKKSAVATSAAAKPHATVASASPLVSTTIVGTSASLRRTTHRPKVVAQTWDEPTYKDSIANDKVDGEDITVRKAAVEALTVGLAKELAADQIRVNAVAPGTIRTAIHAAAGDPGRPDRVARNIPLGRAGEPGEIAPAIAWLLGPEASYVTGAVLRVAGGL